MNVPGHSPALSTDVALDGPASKRLGDERRFMAEDDSDRANEYEAEREAEIEDELERIDRDPDEVDEGDGNLGTQNAPREDADDLEEAEEAAESDADEEAD
ncbi:hypothetical protein C489_17244 [Natrinema versiforme JCM 10478]|uniref:Uncharacterized protein n=2 Tax=Natrinema versiforme TaxID=88724 RepID=L9XS03_9EURY|nr:hypothetical protein [Natrinema versiforme]ELY64520.1 hypothetical protein C489_17244 [Natrinema versiforme JCM 10478]